MDPSLVKRLGFVKYLYEIGIVQSHQPEPANASSLLIFHDAIELFNQIASEYLDVGIKEPKFMDYWDFLPSKLSSGSLPQKESMRRLNKARVALKHHGTLPARIEIESFYASVMNYFAEATTLIFGIKFDELSLIDFIESDQTRVSLKNALAFIEQGDYIQAILMAEQAFKQLIRDYENPSNTRYTSSPFFFGPDFAFIDSYRLGLNPGSNKLFATDDFQRNLGDFIDRIIEKVEAHQEAIRILAFSIDYRKYSRFRLTVQPYISPYHLNRETVVPAKTDTEFCIKFVVETALKLQEVDWSEGNYLDEKM